MKTIIDFLTQLQKNNNRDWFNENKKKYENAKSEFDSFIDNLISEVYKFDPSIGTLSAKQCTFRIYRDVRFSKDKSPYKTNMGGFICKGGRNSGFPGYYLHIEPGKSMIAGGIYMPPAELLKKVRQEIMYNTDEFKKIINNKSFIKTFNRIEGEKLKRPPKDFPSDFPDIDLLKFKSYTVFKEVGDNEVLDKNFDTNILDVFKAMLPLNNFISRAMS